jgi:hypothetical protein
MKKISTAVAKQIRNISEQKLTIGCDRFSRTTTLRRSSRLYSEPGL